MRKTCGLSGDDVQIDNGMRLDARGMIHHGRYWFEVRWNVMQRYVMLRNVMACDVMLWSGIASFVMLCG